MPINVVGGSITGAIAVTAAILAFRIFKSTQRRRRQPCASDSEYTLATPHYLSKLSPAAVRLLVRGRGHTRTTCPSMLPARLTQRHAACLPHTPPAPPCCLPASHTAPPCCLPASHTAMLPARLTQRQPLHAACPPHTAPAPPCCLPASHTAMLPARLILP